MNHKILACDLDGVIFKFNDRYMDMFKQLHNIDALQRESDTYPHVWNYEKDFATPEQIDAVWKWISDVGDYEFWRFMSAYDGAKEFLARVALDFTDVYFVTARNSKRAKKASEDALVMLGVQEPKVIVAHDKVPHLIGIGATDFLDDRDKNFEDVLKYAYDTKMHGCTPYEPRMWMLDRPWNREYQHPSVKRIKNVMEIF